MCGKYYGGKFAGYQTHTKIGSLVNDRNALKLVYCFHNHFILLYYIPSCIPFSVILFIVLSPLSLDNRVSFSALISISERYIL